MAATKSPPPEDKIKLGSRIKRARLAMRMSQLALAHNIGLKGDDAGAYICRVEAGQEPRSGNLQRIARALGVSLDDLLAPSRDSLVTA